MPGRKIPDRKIITFLKCQAQKKSKKLKKVFTKKNKYDIYHIPVWIVGGWMIFSLIKVINILVKAM